MGFIGQGKLKLNAKSEAGVDAGGPEWTEITPFTQLESYGEDGGQSGDEGAQLGGRLGAPLAEMINQGLIVAGRAAVQVCHGFPTARVRLEERQQLKGDDGVASPHGRIAA